MPMFFLGGKKTPRKIKCSVMETDSIKIQFQTTYSNFMTLSHLQGTGEAFTDSDCVTNTCCVLFQANSLTY